MREKNIYQCDADCKSCTYEKKNPTGYDDFDECTTDKCPNNHTLLGNIDKLQGRHSDGYGWNPLGEFCNFCTHTSCEECIKWTNREKKLRNNIPTELKSVKKQVHSEERKEIIAEKPKENPNQSVIEQALKIMEEEKRIKKSQGANQAMFDSNNTFIDTTRIKEVKDKTDNLDLENFNDDKNTKNINDDNLFDTSENIEEVNEFDETEIEDLDFGVEPETTENSDEYYNVSFMEEEDDEIPPPSDFEGFDENEEDEETDKEQNSKNNNIDNGNNEENKENDMDDDEDEDEDYEDYDEDDEAEFSLFEQTKKLKASILFAPDTKIAQYNVRNNGVYLTVEGNSKVTVKGRNDSDGFSYCDPNRFPRYVREGIISGELYRNENIQITDNSKFIFVYYHKIDDDYIKKDTMECKADLTDASEEKLRKLLKLAMDKFEEKQHNNN